MGTSYTAYTVLGCRIPPEKARREVKEKMCTHAFDRSQAKYCPECGSRAWSVRKEVIPAFDQMVDEYPPRPGEMGAVSGQYETADAGAIYVGCVLTVEAGYEPVAFLPLGSAKVDHCVEHWEAKCREFLEPLGLWDPKQFGAWCLLTYG